MSALQLFSLPFSISGQLLIFNGNVNGLENHKLWKIGFGDIRKVWGKWHLPTCENNRNAFTVILEDVADISWTGGFDGLRFPISASSTKQTLRTQGKENSEFQHNKEPQLYYYWQFIPGSSRCCACWLLLESTVLKAVNEGFKNLSSKSKFINPWHKNWNISCGYASIIS